MNFSPALLFFLGTAPQGGVECRVRPGVGNAGNEVFARLGGMTRALILSPEKRSAIARKAAASRWAHKKKRRMLAGMVPE